MVNNSLRRLLNALAFANVGNQSEFLLLLEQLENPASGLPFVHSVVLPRSLGPNKDSPIATNSYSYHHLAKP